MRSAGAALLVALAAGAAPGQAPPAEAAPDPSPWYLERGTQPRPAAPDDPVPPAALLLAGLLRDGGVPGFYDGQFASLAGHVDELARLANDPDLNHVLRVMAVMALQEVADGETVRAALDPLVLSARAEVDADQRAWESAGWTSDPGEIADFKAADLSQHARFALAKDGQPRRVLEKIKELEDRIHRWLPRILDPRLDIDRFPNDAWRRQVVFDIGYHYQQFDDFEHAAEWFRKLTDNLPGQRETRWAHYNMACIAALQGRPDEAMRELQAAVDVGFSDTAWLEEDGDLASLRGREDFRRLIAGLRGEPAGFSEPEPAAPPPGG